MKKFINWFLLAFICLFLSVDTVFSLSTASTGENEVNLRNSPSTDSSVKLKIPNGSQVTLISDTKSSGAGCTDNWYEVEYNQVRGYVCGTYLSDINWLDTNNQVDLEAIYKAELAKFPSDYKTKIEALHKIYPNAIFKAQNVGLNFNTFSEYQYRGYSPYELNNCPLGLEKGVSLLEDTNHSRDGLKSMDSWAYNVLSDYFKTDWPGGQVDRWYIPSLNTVKYYLDPRNFLTSTGIFMFEDLTYAGDGYYTTSNIEKMLTGSFMSYKNATNKLSKNITFAQAFLDAASKNNVNPYFLVARVLQEVGMSRSTMVSGTYPGYVGYYNFYNINAYGTSVAQTLANGLAKAKSEGWNNEYDAIVGGAKFIASDYVAVGQNTTYFQKFDIYGPCYAHHQYMQNIEAPLSEAYKSYNTYNKNNLLKSNFVFLIPVYNSMPTTTSLDDTRNSNNYLKDLTINGTTLEGFNYQKTDYTINVSPLVASVEIAATKASSKSSLSGIGKFNLTGTSQTKDIVVKAQNGSVRTYKITVTRNADIPISISEILNTMLVNSDGTYISGIKLNTYAYEFIKKAQEIDKNATLVIKNNTGVIKTNDIIATGDSLTITSGSDTKTFTFVIYGDTNGDGLINSKDYVRIKNHIMSSSTLTLAYKEAADANKDGLVSSKDYVKVKNHIMGSGTITQ